MGHRSLRFGLSSINDQLDPVCCGVGESVENEITHKNVQKKVKCDPCAQLVRVRPVWCVRLFSAMKENISLLDNSRFFNSSQQGTSGWS